jgi:hypothetical protein
MSAKKKVSLKQVSTMSDCKEEDFAAKVTEHAMSALNEAYNRIYEFEENDCEDEDALIEDLDCIRSTLDDCAEDGWDGYRDEIDALSNRLWLLGVAWPQFLPVWSMADVVQPEDVDKGIRHTYIYEDDFKAIREFSDMYHCTFKEAAHELLRRGIAASKTHVKKSAGSGRTTRSRTRKALKGVTLKGTGKKNTKRSMHA